MLDIGDIWGKERVTPRCESREYQKVLSTENPGDTPLEQKLRNMKVWTLSMPGVGHSSGERCPSTDTPLEGDPYSIACRSGKRNS